jgi:hypothetical protein
MSISAQEAKDLCTQDEFKLVQASFPPQIAGLSPARLRQKVDRSRKLEDKFRDLSRRQNRTTKQGDTDRTRRANERTAKKSQLFGEARERFEKRLAEAEG